MGKFAAAVLAGFMTVAGAAVAHSSPLVDGLFQVLEETGMRNISVRSASETAEGMLTLDDLTAEHEGTRIQIVQIVATNASVSDDGFAADQIVIHDATRMSEDFVIGFTKLNLSNVSLPYSETQRELKVPTAIMTNGVVMDSAMNALSIDRLVLSQGGGFDVSYQGKTSAQILSALIPWSLSPASNDLVDFRGEISAKASTGGEADVALSLELEGYGSYRLRASLSNVADDISLAKAFAALEDAIVERAELELADMEWLAEALDKHNEDEQSQFIVFLSKIFGGLVARLGSFSDGLLIERNVVDFLKAPSGVSIQVVPSRSFKDIIGSERKSLNFNISRRM